MTQKLSSPGTRGTGRGGNEFLEGIIHIVKPISAWSGSRRGRGMSRHAGVPPGGATNPSGATITPTAIKIALHVLVLSNHQPTHGVKEPALLTEAAANPAGAPPSPCTCLAPIGAREKSWPDLFFAQDLFCLVEQRTRVTEMKSPLCRNAPLHRGVAELEACPPERVFSIRSRGPSVSTQRSEDDLLCYSRGPSRCLLTGLLDNPLRKIHDCLTLPSTRVPSSVKCK
ncbi:hypothetical protein GJAV_G00226920 [Gymnothorax javanicus]|nr:hypothetical protein GJAV_G00226920 [Gymnothorax javanicus]